MLHKPFARSFTPAVPGVEAVPGGQYCYSAPSSGRWEMQTQYIKLYPVNGRVETPPGTIGTNVVYLPNGQIDYVVATVVTSVWVPAGDSGAPRCVSYPAIEGRAAVPARTSLQPVVGWDAGANSVQSHDGACEAVWTMGAVIGVYVGLTTNLESVHDPLRYSHAFYFHQSAGRPVFRLREAGADVSGDMEYQPEDEFRIRRVGTAVAYFRNGTLLHTSATPSAGEIYLGTSLYASGDNVPSTQVELPTPAGEWIDILSQVSWTLYGPNTPTSNPATYTGVPTTPIGLRGEYTPPEGLGVAVVRAVATVTTTEGAPGDQAELYFDGSDFVAPLVSGVTTIATGDAGYTRAGVSAGVFSFYVDMDLTTTMFSNITFEFLSLEVQLVPAGAPPL